MTSRQTPAIDASIGFCRGELALDLSFSVERGEVVALVGPNGAGKTTLLRILAGLERISSGRLVVAGVVVDQRDPEIHVDPANRPVGMLFQNRALFSGMSVADNVAFGLRSRGESRATAKASAMRWLERMGLDGLGDVRPGRLSGGEAQRVALARALAVDPRVLLLDEPLTAVDAGARPPLRDLLRRHLAELDGACVIVSHDPADIRAIAHRVLVIENGRIVQSGTTDEVLGNPTCDYARALARDTAQRSHDTAKRSHDTAQRSNITDQR